MTSFAIAAIVFGGSFGAALLGMVLHVKLRDRHLDAGSQDVVKLVMGLIATMAALVLGLLIASANTSYERQNNELKALAAKIIILDHSLELYGPGAQAARLKLHNDLRQAYHKMWSPDGVQPEVLNSIETRNLSKGIHELLLDLTPKTDTERMMQNQAIQLTDSVTQSRLQMFEWLDHSISWPFLTVLIFWICMLFLGFGLFARFNATVTVALFVGALSVSSAILLILELNDPYRGLMRISDEPVRNALTEIDH